jgi:hypothetical protein
MFVHMVKPRTEHARMHSVGPVHIQTRFKCRTCQKMNKNNENISSPCKLECTYLVPSMQKGHSNPDALSMHELIHLHGLVSAGVPVMIEMCWHVMNEDLWHIAMVHHIFHCSRGSCKGPDKPKSIAITLSAWVATIELVWNQTLDGCWWMKWSASQKMGKLAAYHLVYLISLLKQIQLTLNTHQYDGTFC